METFTVVIVAYPLETGFMHLQARSIARFVPRERLAAILVVENGPLAASWREPLRREYGELADLVEFVPARAVTTMPETTGWFAQQILKLMIAAHVRTKHYLILDAKNHFIFPFTGDEVERNGKPRTFVYNYVGHPLQGYLEAVLRFYDLPDHHVQRFLPTTTPFYVNRQLVLDTIADFKQRSRSNDFASAFCQAQLTEFFIIAAYILSRGQQFEDVYELTGTNSTVLWKEIGHDDAEIARHVAHAEKQRVPSFSVHRMTVPLLSDTSQTAIAQFWLRRGLFSSVQAARQFLLDQSKTET